jgi:hypothetical protein
MRSQAGQDGGIGAQAADLQPVAQRLGHRIDEVIFPMVCVAAAPTVAADEDLTVLLPRRPHRVGQFLRRPPVVPLEAVGQLGRVGFKEGFQRT